MPLPGACHDVPSPCQTGDRSHSRVSMVLRYERFVYRAAVRYLDKVEVIDSSSVGPTISFLDRLRCTGNGAIVGVWLT